MSYSTAFSDIYDEVARDTWRRYSFMRDWSHADFVRKAEKCELFTAGLQWEEADLRKLAKQRRPALTLNEILRTLSNVLGEQIRTRSDIAFRPAKRGKHETASALGYVYQQIASANQLDWLRSEVYADGLVTSRGFYDVRLDFQDNMQGEVRISRVNPKNVLIDPDASDYDPDEWQDVITTSWWSLTDIKAIYGDSAVEELRSQAIYSSFSYEYDAVEKYRDAFGRKPDGQILLPYNYWRGEGSEAENQVRSIRMLDRQYRETVMMEYFVDMEFGDMRPVPAMWDRDRIAIEVEKMGYAVIKRPGKRIRWNVVGCGTTLFNEWSPYRNFTIVPYFPHLRYGRSVGLVENLLSPQELLNKTTSQELHVVNTSANSGWKTKVGNIVNMTTEELETRGAETGLVLEMNDITQTDKIHPNQVPTGLDNLSRRAEDFIKVIANVSDSMLGFDREDVAAKAIAAKQARGAVNLIKPIDNLERSDWLLARTILSMVQDYYTEKRIVRVTLDEETGKTEEIMVNEQSAAGEIIYDLTLGEYEIIVSSQPDKATIEDSQFEQAKTMKEMGIQIPDRVIIENSRLHRRNELIKQMEEQAKTPDPGQQLELEKLSKEIEKLTAEVDRINADAASMRTRAAQTAVQAMNEAEKPPEQPEQGNDDALIKEAARISGKGTSTPQPRRTVNGANR
jgi:hypothetical protein